MEPSRATTERRHSSRPGADPCASETNTWPSSEGGELNEDVRGLTTGTATEQEFLRAMFVVETD